MAKRLKRESYLLAQQARQDGELVDLPQKKFYRQRAHANPFSDHNLSYPACPNHMDWASLYPSFFPASKGSKHSQDISSSSGTTPINNAAAPLVEVADIGCGFGGLLVALAPVMPLTLILGLEIRDHVTEFVQNRIRALRAQNAPTGAGVAGTAESARELEVEAGETIGEATTEDREARPEATEEPEATKETKETKATEAAPQTASAATTSSAATTAQAAPPQHPPYSNVACVRANTMKFLPNFFLKGQLRKIFLCFPDPHFKARKHKARIVSPTLCAEYAYVLRPGEGRIYTITDVEDLHRWMVGHLEAHPAFVRVDRISEDAVADDTDPCVQIMHSATEEAKKVERNSGQKFIAVFRRLEDPPWPDEAYAADPQ